MRGMILGISAVAFICFVMGCGGKSKKVDDRYLGSWRYYRQHVNKKMTFRSDGTWAGEVVIQGRLDKTIEKKESVPGIWYATEGLLYVTPQEDGTLGGWVADQTILFEVVTLTKANLGLRRGDGNVENWALVKSHKQQKGKAKLTMVSMQPIIVNMAGEALDEKPKYLCVYLELALDAGGQPQTTSSLHPRVQEAAILHLSTLAHRDVNTMDKVESIREALFNVISPYLGGTLRGVNIKNIIITPEWNNVEEFVKKSTEAAEQKKTKKS